MKNFCHGFCCTSSKSPAIVLSKTIYSLRKMHKTKNFGMPPKILQYMAPSSGHELLNLNLRSDVWNENAALFQTMEIH